VARVFLLRNGVMFILSYIPGVGALVGIANVVMLFMEERRCVHDHIADTLVVIAQEQWLQNQLGDVDRGQSHFMRLSR